MIKVRAFPGLGNGAVHEWVRLERENALDEARLALAIVVEDRVEGFLTVNFDLAVLPARNLDDEVDDILVAFVWVEGDVMPERDGIAVLLKPNAPFLVEC